MIREAAKAGCWAVKFQYYKTEELYPKSHPYYSWVKQAELTIQQLAELKEAAEAEELKFICTCFKNPKHVDSLETISLEHYKIRQADSENTELIDRILQTNRTVFISCVKRTLEPYYLFNPKIKWLLCCTPKYPTSIEEVQFSRIPAFHGISDHTQDTITAFTAAVLWLYEYCETEQEYYIEKHVRLDGDEDCLEKEWSVTFSQIANLTSKLNMLEKASFAPKIPP
jgi:sialic acid synthase SpsE